MNLETNLSRRLSKERPFTCAVSGSPEKTIFAGEFDDEGKFSVKSVGKVNLYEEIQMYRDSCDINTILERYSAGDDSALQRANGFFADFSAFPDNYAGVFNMIENCKDFFDKMPASFKEKYGNNFETFMTSAEAEDFLPKIKQEPSSVNPTPQNPIVKPIENPVVQPSTKVEVTNES